MDYRSFPMHSFLNTLAQNKIFRSLSMRLAHKRQKQYFLLSIHHGLLRQSYANNGRIETNLSTSVEGKDGIDCLTFYYNQLEWKTKFFIRLRIKQTLREIFYCSGASSSFFYLFRAGANAPSGEQEFGTPAAFLIVCLFSV